MANSNQINRREFLVSTGQGTAGLAGAAWLTGAAPATGAVLGANDRPRFAFIGVAGQGRFNLQTLLKEPNVEVPVICDVNLPRAHETVKLIGGKAEVEQDYRRVLQRKDIDGVFVATPDHWHALITIHACQAGKDVYVEKPMTHVVAEGPVVIAAAKKHQRVVQVGTQQLSGERYAEAAELIRAGGLGRVHHVRSWNTCNRTPGIRKPEGQKVPEGLDWDLWLGPAPMRPYDSVRCSGNHRFFWDYAGGRLTDLGVHQMGTIQKLMDVKGPLSAVAVGGKFAVEPWDYWDTPDTLNVLWEYPGWTCEFVVRDGSAYAPEGARWGIVLHGTKGAMFIDRGGFEIMPDDKRTEHKIVGTPRKSGDMPTQLSGAHIRNFLDCMRSRKQPVANPTEGHRATVPPLLGNIAFHVGRKIRWDPEKDQIIDDPQAAALLTKTFRAPHVLPKEV
ncbi:MAG: Gfo/Idh/MocA family oxidoreductase [Phycisphaerae bacterium]|nr:Gfo/Idh/MocA family oxidoreductase [Phycisphaerae bacterium]